MKEPFEIYFVTMNESTPPYIPVIQDDKEVLDFYEAHKDDDVKTLVHAVMTNEEFWGQDLTKILDFEEVTVKNLTLIREQGAKAAYASVL